MTTESWSFHEFLLSRICVINLLLIMLTSNLNMSLFLWFVNALVSEIFRVCSVSRASSNIDRSFISCFEKEWYRKFFWALLFAYWLLVFSWGFEKANNMKPIYFILFFQVLSGLGRFLPWLTVSKVISYRCCFGTGTRMIKWENSQLVWKNCQLQSMWQGRVL